MNKDLALKQLIRRCCSNERLAQQELYAQFVPYLNAISQRYLNCTSDAKDVLQDTFISIFKNIHQHDPTRASFKTWATRITINCCFKYNQRNQKKRTEEFIPEQHQTAINEAVVDRMTNQDILKYLKKMPPNYYQVFNLHVIDGFNHSEIAQLLQIEESLSRKRLSRARKWIKEYISKDTLIL